MQTTTIKHSDQLVTAAASHFDFSTAGRVLVAMTTFARQQDGAWVCWPSKATLAELAGVTARTVQTAIKQLADAGVITIQTRLARSSIYHLNTALIVKPSQAVINALATISSMPATLAERVTQATSRLQAIREQYKQGRSAVTPPGDKPRISPCQHRGDQSDLPNKDLVTTNKRSEQHAQSARSPSPVKTETRTSKPVISVRALEMCMQAAAASVASLTSQLQDLFTSKAPVSDFERIRAELARQKAKHAEFVNQIALASPGMA